MFSSSYDIVICGAGIAGLYCALILQKQGYNVAIFETGKVGEKQTIHSQGIIHGGLKYALNGILSKEATIMSELPARWNKNFLGEGEINLAKTKVLSEYQNMFSTSFLSNVSGLFAKRSMQGKVDEVKKNEWDETIIANPSIKRVYKVHEPVIDVPSLLHDLSSQINNIYNVKKCESVIENNEVTKLIIDNKSVTAKHYIFAAGENNPHLYKDINPNLKMQLRPLHMVTATGDLPKCYGHYLGASKIPKLTITSHPNLDCTTWYIGGQIAENGVKLSREKQITETKSLLNKLIPNIDFSDIKFETYKINRAELKTKTGLKPERPTVIKINNTMIVWPTKLAFAPIVADEIISLLENTHKTKSSTKSHNPIISQPIWS